MTVIAVALGLLGALGVAFILLLAAVLWTVFPALGAAIRTARHPGPTDELLPRF